MSVTIETDLKDILTRIDQRMERMEKDITDLKIGQVELKGDIKTLSGKVEGEIKNLSGKVEGDIKNLDGKVDSLAKRFDNLEFISRAIIISIVVALLTGAAKLFGLLPNPPV